MSDTSPAEPTIELSVPVQSELDVTVRTTVDSLLAARGIGRFIVVDDEIDAMHNGGLSVVLAHIETIREHLVEIAAAHTDLVGFESIGEMEQDDLRGDVRANWSKFSTEEQSGLICSIDSVDTPPIISSLSWIKEWLPSNVEFRSLSVKEWDETGKSLLDQPAIVLFDRNLTNAERGPTGGDNLIREIDADTYPSVAVAMITREAPDLNEEARLSDEVTTMLGRPVAVLGKYRIGEPNLLYAGVLLLLVLESVHELREAVVKATEAAAASSVAKLRSVDAYSALVTLSAAHFEGLLEVDGLMRIADGDRQRALAVEMRSAINLVHLRALRELLPDGVHELLPTSPSVREHRHAERFDTLEHLSRCESPTAPGDIYEITTRDGKKCNYMLLVQPCDIVVRTTGSRSNEPETFTLAKLTSKVQEGQARVSIGPFSVDDDADSKIDLRYRIEVNPLLLDACVFSPEGRCVLGEAPVGDDRRTVGWQTKALKMQKVSTRAINAANKSIESFDSQLGPDFDPAVAASTRTALAEHSIDQLLGSGRFQVVFSDQKIFIGIRRIGRLLPPVAGAVWTALLQHQGRPDQPGPLVRQGSGVPSAETTPATPPPASNEDGPAAPALPNER